MGVKFLLSRNYLGSKFAEKPEKIGFKASKSIFDPRYRDFYPKIGIFWDFIAKNGGLYPESGVFRFPKLPKTNFFVDKPDGKPSIRAILLKRRKNRGLEADFV